MTCPNCFLLFWEDTSTTHSKCSVSIAKKRLHIICYWDLTNNYSFIRRTDETDAKIRQCCSLKWEMLDDLLLGPSYHSHPRAVRLKFHFRNISALFKLKGHSFHPFMVALSEFPMHWFSTETYDFRNIFLTKK